MIAKTVRENVLAIASAYMKATGLSMTTVSARFYGNVDFLKEFKAGRKSISIDKLDSLIAKFRASWPSDTDWPFLRTIYMDRTFKK